VSQDRNALDATALLFAFEFVFIYFGLAQTAAPNWHSGSDPDCVL
jgi:hypothetical protein